MKESNIKNYSSKSPASTSIAKVEQVLADLGASRIVKDFDSDGAVTSIMFEININGSKVVFKLPAKVEACFKVFWEDVKKPREGTRQIKMEQAERTAWKIILDWVEAQAALIKLEQADFREVFLPYAYNPASGKTLFEIAEEKGLPLLLESN